MARIKLRLYTDPGGAEVFINVRRKDGYAQRLTTFVDTGAAVSLLPVELMATLAYRLSERGVIMVEQAGMAKHAFEATEAFVTLSLEDHTGTQTGEFEARVWFADTDALLIGFDGVLNRAILHIDMQDRHEGWIEMDV